MPATSACTSTRNPSSDNEPRDYAYRHTPPAERRGQLTRQGRSKVGLDHLARRHMQWFIVRTVPREEMRAALILEMAGRTVLYPRHAVFRRKSRYSKTKIGILRPLMASYLFVGFAQAPNWLQTLSCASISGVISLSGRPVEISFAAITAFMQGNIGLDAPDHHRFMLTHREFGIGQMVEVLGGPFDGHHVKVETIRRDHAIAILTILGREQAVNLPLDNLAALRA